MAIAIGPTILPDSGSLSVGGTPVSEVWVGSTKIWPAAAATRNLYHFRGDDFIDTQNCPQTGGGIYDLQEVGDSTVSFWIKFEDATSYQEILGNRATYTLGVMAGLFRLDPGASYAALTPIVANVWYFVTWQITAVSTIIQVRDDAGNNHGSDVVPGVPAASPANPLWFGATNPNSGFSGYLADVSIRRNYPPEVHDAYRIDDGSGTDIANSGTSANRFPGCLSPGTGSWTTDTGPA